MSNVHQITIVLDGILAMENYKNTQHLVCLYMRFPYCYITLTSHNTKLISLSNTPIFARLVSLESLILYHCQ